MQAKSFVSVVKALTLLVLLSACAKADYDGRARLQPFSNKMSTPPPATQQQQNPPATAVAVKLPVISFVQTAVTMNSKMEAQLELQLSEASNTRVVAVIELLDQSARHHRDYTGFKTPSRNYEVVQHVEFAPGETRKSLPIIGGRTRYADIATSCNSTFLARINAMKLVNARVINDRAQVLAGELRRQPK